MNQLHEFLKHFTVRMIDRVEVEKPEKDNFNLEVTREQGGENETSIEFREDYYLEAMEKYNAATEVIKLPNWMEFWDTLIGCSVRNEKTFKEVAAINNEYLILMSTPTQLEMFILWDGEVLEEPQSYQDYLRLEMISFCNLYTGNELKECKRFQQTQQKVIFEGWEVFNDGEVETLIWSENANVSFQKDGSIHVFVDNSIWREIKTLDDLNREVQLYMKIK